MELGFRQQQTQAQKLHLSQEMRQSLDVLQMPFDALHTYIMEQISQNPMLEITESPHEMLPEVELPESDDAQKMDDILTSEDILSHRLRKQDAEPFTAEYKPEWGGHSTEPDFFEELREQIGGLPLDEQMRWLCDYLVDCLDRRGYLAFEADVLAGEVGIPVFDMMQAVYVLQSLTPVGVGARTLQECLILQLAAGDHFCGETISLVREGLPLLAKNDIPGLSRLLGCNRDEAAFYAGVVRALNPIPSRGYNTGEHTTRTVPDAIITRQGDGFAVDLCRPYLPKLELSPEYLELMAQSDDKELQRYLKNCRSQATAVAAAVDHRFNTIQRIILHIIQTQPTFLLNGTGLLPMTLSDVAGCLSLHVSTISRAIQGKYIVCPAGTFRLRDFFSTGLRTENQPELSSMQVRAKINQFIKAEDSAAPLSDEALRQALEAVGIVIARRTVAKYREAEGFQKASARYYGQSHGAK